MAEAQDSSRRPLKSRSRPWAVASAAWLARRRVAPNTISKASVLFAAGACAALAARGCVGPWLGRSALLILAAGCIQGRLLCNLFDGMVAVEGGMRSKTGDLYNEIPDRIADPLILIGAGYAAAAVPYGIELGYLAAVLAVLTAYIRALGKSLGTPVFFQGPMAKQQRMAAITVACVAGAGVTFWGFEARVLWATLLIVVLGCVATVIRRVRLVARALEQR